MSAKKNILLVGGGGYVGTAIAYHLLQNNYQVTVLDEFVYNNQFTLQLFLNDPNFKLVKGDLGDSTVLAAASKNVSNVVILGGLVGDPVTKDFPAESEKINYKGVQSCIDFFDDKDIQKLIFISTCSNYGLIGENELADENFTLTPLSAYAKAKVAAENHLMSKKGKTKYSGVVLRFATAFGLSARMRFDLTVNEFVRDLFFGNELVVFDEHTWRPYCHVADFARLIDIVLNAENAKVNFEVFNAGGDVNNYTKKMIVDTIVELLPQSKIKYGANGSDPRNYRVNFNKVKTVLQFEPAYSVTRGIQELITAMQQGFFADSVADKNRYGNYQVHYKG